VNRENWARFLIQIKWVQFCRGLIQCNRGTAQAAKLHQPCENVAMQLISIKDVGGCMGFMCSTDSPSCLREEKMPWLKQQPSFR
jgi:hypothetical protein